LALKRRNYVPADRDKSGGENRDERHRSRKTLRLTAFRKNRKERETEEERFHRYARNPPGREGNKEPKEGGTPPKKPSPIANENFGGEGGGRRELSLASLPTGNVSPLSGPIQKDQKETRRKEGGFTLKFLIPGRKNPSS